MATLTKRQREVLNFITIHRQRKEYAPSLDEIRKKFKLASVSTAHFHVSKLRDSGYLIKEDNKPRGITATDVGTPVIISLLGTIPAGGPIEAVTNPEVLEVPKNMLSKTGRHFALRVAGDSMIEEGIFDGDVVILREQATVEDGESAVAYLPKSNQVTLKKIYREPDRIRLQPANSKLRPFYEDRVEIQGKVISVLRMM